MINSIKKYLSRIVLLSMVCYSAFGVVFANIQSAHATFHTYFAEGFSTSFPELVSNGWTFSEITETYPSIYGAAAPSLKFDSSGDTLITPVFSNANKLSFWARGQANNTSGSLIIDYRDSADWHNLNNLSIVNSQPQNIVYDIPASAVQIRFTYLKTINNVALDDVSVYLDIDDQPPVITGVEDGKYYNSDLTINFSDDQPGVTAQLNGTPFSSGTTVSVEGSYSLEVVDQAGNKTAANFIIDKTAPTATVSYSTVYPTTENVIATVIPSETIVEGTLTHEFTVNGSYLFTFTDLAGNTGSVEAVVANIDRTKPIVTVTKDPLFDISNQNYIVTVEYFDDNLDKKTYILDSSTELNYEGPVIVSGNGTHTFVAIATDKAGNRTESDLITFVIDTEGPSAPTNVIAFDHPNDAGKSIDITWQPSTSPDIAGYQVKVSKTNVEADADPALTQNLGNITSTTLVGLENNIPYYVFVSGFDSFGNVGNSGYYLLPVFAVDNITPLISAVTVKGADILEVAYNYNSLGTSVVELYVSTDKNFSNYIVVNQKPASGLFTLSTVDPTKTYYFKLQATDLLGNKSAFSEIKTGYIGSDYGKGAGPVTISALQEPAPIAEEEPVVIASTDTPTVNNSDKDNSKKDNSAPEIKDEPEVKGTQDKKEESSKKNWFLIILLFAAAAAAYYGYKKLPNDDSGSPISKSKESNTAPKTQENPKPPKNATDSKNKNFKKKK